MTLPYHIFIAHSTLVGESLSHTTGAVIRCAPKDDIDSTSNTRELRFCLPTLTDVHIVDCINYSEKQDAPKLLWHDLQAARLAKERGLFIRFMQYAEICLHVEQTYHYKFPQLYYPRIKSNLFSKLVENNISGQLKREYHFRRQTNIRFLDSNMECVVLIFNKNVFFVPTILWNRTYHKCFDDPIFGEDCHDARLFKKSKKLVFKISFRKDSPILLQAEVVLDKTQVQQKIKDNEPFCVIRGDQFQSINLPSFCLLERFNRECVKDYRMCRRIVAKGHIKARRKSNIKQFTLIYLDFFDDDESKEVILEKNSPNEMIGRSLTMLVIPENCQV